MNETEIKRLKSSRWVQLVIGLILLLMLGLIYAWSVFRGPLMEDIGDGVKNTFSITMIMFCIGGLIGGIINGKTSPKITMILCLIFVFIGVLGTSMAGWVLEELAWVGSPAHPTSPVTQSGNQTAELCERPHTHPSRMPPLILSGHFWHMDHLSVKFIPAMSIK